MAGVDRDLPGSQRKAAMMGRIKFLTAGEIDTILKRTGAFTFNRAWENWCRRAGREPQTLE
jgi:hypothetical protein